MKQPSMAELRDLYAKGVNITEHLRGGASENTREAVHVAYELQAGSYVGSVTRDYRRMLQQQVYTSAIAEVISPLRPATILDAGVGEATTLCYVIPALEARPTYVSGFDIAYGRIRHARDFCRPFEPFFRPALTTGDLFDIPKADNSFDLVLTSHAIEPHRGREKDALAELARVSRRWLALFEPSYELGSDESRARMDGHGYVRGLLDAAEAVGLQVMEHRLLEVSINPLNPTGVHLFRKDGDGASGPRDACPACKTALHDVRGHLYCRVCSLVYPVIDGIPCLLRTNGILATDFQSESR